MPALLAAIFIFIFVLSGCQPATTRQTAATNNGTITIAAASDLKPALTKIASAFEKDTGARVKTVFGSSGLLARQIENGAPFDLFFSANKQYVDDLASQDLVVGVKPYAFGFIVLVGRVKTIDDLAGPKVSKIAIANPEHAPYGVAAKTALTRAGLWTRIKSKLVFGENVGQTYEFLKTGNTDAAIVALSLAKADRAEYSPINPKLYPPIEQWVALLRQANQPAAAGSFLTFLRTDEARRALAAYGFKVVR